MRTTDTTNSTGRQGEGGGKLDADDCLPALVGGWLGVCVCLARERLKHNLLLLHEEKFQQLLADMCHVARKPTIPRETPEIKFKIRLKVGVSRRTPPHQACLPGCPRHVLWPVCCLTRDKADER